MDLGREEEGEGGEGIREGKRKEGGGEAIISRGENNNRGGRGGGGGLHNGLRL